MHDHLHLYLSSFAALERCYAVCVFFFNLSHGDERMPLDEPDCLCGLSCHEAVFRRAWAVPQPKSGWGRIKANWGGKLPRWAVFFNYVYNG